MQFLLGCYPGLKFGLRIVGIKILKEFNGLLRDVYESILSDEIDIEAFIDEFDDTYYVDGSKVISKGKLDLTEKEYKQLIKDIKKTLKYTEHEINRESYAVIKYGWVRDSVWVYFNKKAFSAVKSDINYLNSKL